MLGHSQRPSPPRRQPSAEYGYRAKQQTARNPIAMHVEQSCVDYSRKNRLLAFHYPHKTKTHRACDSFDEMHKIISEEGNLLRVSVSGKLTTEDYDALIPACEKTIAQHGSMRLLFLMENFEGWEPGAAWDDFRFGTTHAAKVEKMAAVGEKTWQKWIMKLGSFFMRDTVKYFDSSQLAEAERWIRK